MKYILFIGLLFLSCSKNIQSSKFYYKILEENKFEKTREEITEDKTTNTLTIKKINDSVLNLSLINNDGYEGYKFGCRINRAKKNIYNCSYTEWYDLENQSEYIYTLENIEIFFSEDPFLKKKNKTIMCNFKLRINLKVKSGESEKSESYNVNNFAILED